MRMVAVLSGSSGGCVSIQLEPFGVPLGNALNNSDAAIEYVPSSWRVALNLPVLMALLMVDLLFPVSFAAWESDSSAGVAWRVIWMVPQVLIEGGELKHPQRSHVLDVVVVPAPSQPFVRRDQTNGLVLHRSARSTKPAHL